MVLGMAGVASAQGYQDGYQDGGYQDDTCGYPGYPDCADEGTGGTDTGGNRPDTGELAQTGGADYALMLAGGGSLLAAVLVGRKLVTIKG